MAAKGFEPLNLIVAGLPVILRQLNEEKAARIELASASLMIIINSYRVNHSAKRPIINVAKFFVLFWRIVLANKNVGS